MILEMCIDSVESAIASAEGGANRIEFCANLLEGGTTPSLGAIRETKRRAKIDLSVMVRPRGGDFCHTEEEFAVMQEDVRIFKEEGVDCVVFGLLNPDGTVDVDRTRQLIELANPPLRRPRQRRTRSRARVAHRRKRSCHVRKALYTKIHHPPLRCLREPCK